MNLSSLGENVLVGLIGGLVVSLVIWGTKRVAAWQLTRRFPIAGTYVTQFEDVVEGASVVATSPATLRQRGQTITGETEMDGRIWVLSGELSREGYIHGVYYAKDPIDRGIGNFFLRVGNDRHMTGLWSGFDSANGIITSGRYSFQPTLDDVRIRTAGHRDIVPIIKIADDQLGVGYVDEESFKAIRGEAGFALIAERDGQTVGFALCMRQDLQEAEATMRTAPPRYFRFAEQVGVLKTIAVERRYQGRGVGTSLVDACLERFEVEAIPAVYTVAWKSKKGVNIAGVVERQSFSVINEVPDYWRESSIQEEFECPECHEPPCECVAVMYGKVLMTGPRA